MKKNNIRYSKENFKKLLKYIDNHRKQFVGSVATVGLTGFITLTSFLATACTQEEIDAANELINQLSTEQTVDNPEPEVTVEPEVIEPEVVVEPEVVEPVEEVNPRDMKAVYGLDFDIPIYTEEEVEQAKENLRNNYSEYNDVDGYEFSEEQIEAIKDDYYIANQDLWYQLYSMTKDFKVNTAYVDGKKNYYLEDKDWCIEVSKIEIIIYAENYMFSFKPSSIERGSYDVPNQIIGKCYLSIGPGAYTMIAPGDFETHRNDIKNNAGNFSLEDELEELEHYGFHHEEEIIEFVGYQKSESLTLGD